MRSKYNEHWYRQELQVLGEHINHLTVSSRNREQLLEDTIESLRIRIATMAMIIVTQWALLTIIYLTK